MAAAGKTLRNPSFLGLDAGKMIAAVLVVVTHSRILTTVPTPVARVIGVFISLAVPFFFIVSGFLCFHLSRGSHDAELWRTRKGASTGLWLYVAWTVAYFPASITSFVVEHAGFNVVTFIRYVHKVIFVGEWQLWFLLSMAIGYAVIYGLLRIDKSKYAIFAVGLACYAVSCVIETLQSMSADELPHALEKVIGIYNKVFASPRVLLQGVAYITVGMMLALWYERLHKMLQRRKVQLVFVLASSAFVLTFFSYHAFISSNALVASGIGGVLRFLLAFVVACMSVLWVGEDGKGLFRHIRSVSAVTYTVFIYLMG
ncbi:acyltransferase family protein [Bifidobacterium leontopitheci]|uniref:Acyltransferase 3 domain-containing protein n=1 Tax=Bifidobacterium leontopitheci TaxID=2650774 RepID=A0A6I1GJR4_9BIFI|nr:acyltransferase family protein [Bifidobacterium leontopitheci]KAB7789607.1 hypothetical protein F7D09_1903 [Bifidobacterium leontopitheci]